MKKTGLKDFGIFAGKHLSLYFAIFTKNTCVGVSFYKSCRAEGQQLYSTETPTPVFSCE